MAGNKTVLASAPLSSDLPSATNASTAVVDTATLTQLEQLAEKGNPVAQNVLGLRYATGEGSQLDERAAARWFTKAAEQGNVNAQSNWALFTGWAAVSPELESGLLLDRYWPVRAGTRVSKALATVLASHMSRAQSQAIEQQAGNLAATASTRCQAPPGR